MAGDRSGAPTHAIEVSSLLDAPADQVWSQVTDFRGINAELMPLLRMTTPRAWQGRTLDDVRPGEPLFRSWLLLFGVLPIDYDDLCIAEVGPGHRFLERSRMFSATQWQHERVVAETTGGCRLTDRVRFTPRWAPLGLVLRRLVPLLFAHRHRRLRRRFSASRR